jgi:hypothetical protein
LDQENGLIAFAAEPGAIALDEHDGGSIGEKKGRSKNNISLLETTHQAHKLRAGVNIVLKNPALMGEGQPEKARRPDRVLRTGEGE